MVNLMEVAPPATPPSGVAVPGLLIVKGYDVGGLIIVVAVALGTFAPVSGVAFAGGVEVSTVTLFITAKLTCKRNRQKFIKNRRTLQNNKRWFVQKYSKSTKI